MPPCAVRVVGWTTAEAAQPLIGEPNYSARMAARIEACASGGRLLASKALIERLDHEDARALQLDTTHLRYVLLGELHTATDKALRDAPSVAVCDLPTSVP